MASHGTPPELDPSPESPIDQIMNPLLRFLRVEAAGGVVLLAATAVALVLANSSASEGFFKFWTTSIGLHAGGFEFRHSLKHLINDGLMAIFFFVVGLEVKREMVLGELRDLRRAALSIAAALGGMIVPAGLFLLFQTGQPGERGWGIPMATDIAFVVGCMAVLGRRVPNGLRIMMLSLAIADDIGAILVIAIGYSHGLQLHWLVVALAGLVSVVVLGRLGVRSLLVYTVAGVFVWYAFHESGIHATVAGVILGLMTPAHSRLTPGFVSRVLERARVVLEGDDWRTDTHRGDRVRRFQRTTREVVSPLEYLISALHPWVSFVILPVFALANAGVPIRPADFGAPISLAVMLGLLLGKPIGIVLSSLIAVKVRIARLPEKVTWMQVTGGGFLAGIGFTMALFIAGLALDGALLDTAKVGILAGSLASAVVGGLVLLLAPTTSVTKATQASPGSRRDHTDISPLGTGGGTASPTDDGPTTDRRGRA